MSEHNQAGRTRQTVNKALKQIDDQNLADIRLLEEYERNPHLASARLAELQAESKALAWKEMADRANAAYPGELDATALFSEEELGLLLSDFAALRKTYTDSFRLSSSDYKVCLALGALAAGIDACAGPMRGAMHGEAVSLAAIQNFLGVKMTGTFSILRCGINLGFIHKKKNVLLTSLQESRANPNSLKDPISKNVVDLSLPILKQLVSLGAKPGSLLGKGEVRTGAQVFRAIAFFLGKTAPDTLTRDVLLDPLQNARESISSELNDASITRIIDALSAAKYDFPALLTMSFSTLVVEVGIRVWVALSAEGEDRPGGIQCLAYRRTSMLFIAHSILVAANTVKIIGTHNPANMNFTEWIRYMSVVFQQAKQCVEKKMVVDVYVTNQVEAEWDSLVAKIDKDWAEVALLMRDMELA